MRCIIARLAYGGIPITGRAGHTRRRGLLHLSPRAGRGRIPSEAQRSEGIRVRGRRRESEPDGIAPPPPLLLLSYRPPPSRPPPPRGARGGQPRTPARHHHQRPPPLRKPRGSKAGRQEAGGFHQGVYVQADVGRDFRACVTVTGSACRDGAAPPAFAGACFVPYGRMRTRADETPTLSLPLSGGGKSEPHTRR